MFWSRPLLSHDMQEWIFDCFNWFDARFQPAKEPVLPTKKFFCAPGGQNEETARLVLEDLKRLMHIDLSIDILPLNLPLAEYRIDYQSLSSIAGTYQETANGSRLIHYDPDLMRQPLLFINTLAHELMHARLSGMEDDVPGGAGAHELATDLGCIIAGLGVFQLQAADDAGWTGYMSQATRAHAFAVFLSRRRQGIEEVSHYLSPRCKKLLIKAMKQL